MTKNSGSKNSIHMGQLLRELADWHGGTYLNFATSIIKRSEKTLHTYFKEERLPSKTIARICDAVGVPKAYFEGKFKLPEKNVLKEPEAVYQSRYSALEKERDELREENRKPLGEIKTAHVKYIALLEEKKEAM